MRPKPNVYTLPQTTVHDCPNCCGTGCVTKEELALFRSMHEMADQYWHWLGHRQVSLVTVGFFCVIGGWALGLITVCFWLKH